MEIDSVYVVAAITMVSFGTYGIFYRMNQINKDLAAIKKKLALKATANSAQY